MKSLEIVNREIAKLDEDDLWSNGELNIIKQDLEKLEKLEKAFEILKSKEIFEFKDDNCLYLNAEDHNWWGDIIESSFVRLSDEEYELLEELMKGETSI